MISVELATALKSAGLVWHPAPGDRFTLTTEAFEGDVFTLSEMVVQAQELPTGTVLGFNGTTEWALDSAEAADALWLPREDQLRELLKTSFRSLERVADGYRVTAVLPGAGAHDRIHERDTADAGVVAGGFAAGALAQPAVADPPGSQPFWGQEPAEAYGRALLALIRRATT